MPFRGSRQREDVMRKTLRRILDLLRGTGSQTQRDGAPIRSGLQEPQN